MQGNERKALEAGLSALGLGEARDECILLERFIDEIRLWNPRYRLVAEDRKSNV